MGRRLIAVAVVIAITVLGLRLWGKHRPRKRLRPPPPNPMATLKELDEIQARLWWGRARVEHWRGLAAAHDPRRMRE